VTSVELGRPLRFPAEEFGGMGQHPRPPPNTSVGKTALITKKTTVTDNGRLSTFNLDLSNRFYVRLTL
jgi:hypothetical protein